MTLGEFIARLETVPADRTIVFDFCNLPPTKFRSYRGYYDQLALGFMPDGEPKTAGALLAEAKACVGATFQGWKGGDYVMHAGTDLWAANPGDSSDTGIAGLVVESYYVLILTTRRNS